MVRPREVLGAGGRLAGPSVYPAVPRQRGGVRFTLTAANSEAQVDRALAALAAVARDLARSPAESTM